MNGQFELYCQLKNTFREHLFPAEVDKFKNDFHLKKLISSKRALSKVTCVDTIFTLLEKRALLSVDNVQELEYIALSIFNRNDLFEIVQQYKSEVEVKDTYRCQICFVTSYLEPNILCNVTHKHGLPTDLEISNSINTDISSVVDYIVRYTGRFWKNLGRRLYENSPLILSENKVEKIDHENNDLGKKCRAMINLWRKEFRDDAKLDILHEALKACGRKDISDDIVNGKHRFTGGAGTNL